MSGSTTKPASSSKAFPGPALRDGRDSHGDEPLEGAVTGANVQSGREQLRRLVESHQAGVWRYLRYLGADVTEADDLTQETFLSVGRSGLNCFETNGKASGPNRSRNQFEERDDKQTAAYLRTAARNQLLMLRRRQKREIDSANIEAAENVWAAATAEDPWDDFRESLRDCVEKLKGRSRKVIDLQYSAGESRTAIAKKLGMTPDGVKTLLRRTRRVLRECIERKQEP